MAAAKAIKTTFVVLLFALFLSLFSFVPKTLATVTTASYWSFLGSTATFTIDTTNITKIEIASSIFDDTGHITIVAPGGGTATVSTPPGCLQPLPVGDISSSFVDGFGPGKIYTITVTVINNCGGPTGSWGNLTVTTLSNPTCTLTASPSSISLMDASTLSWTTTASPTSATIDNGVGSVSVPSGSTSVSPTTNTTYTMNVSNATGGATCSATVSVTGPPAPPTGGLVPCGRLADDPATGAIDESQPCNLCSTFYMVKNIFNFALADIAVPIGVLMLVIAGLIYATAAGNPKRTEQAKTAIKYTLIGLVIVFIAWLIVAALLSMLGYAGIANWNQVNCTL